MKKRLGCFGVKAINILFFVLMLAVMIATVLIDKNINSSFPNTVKYANGGYYMFALFALILVLRLLWCSRKKDIDTRVFYFVLAAIFLVTAGLEWSISGFVAENVVYASGNDFDSVRSAAILLAQNEGTFADLGYFSVYPNNANFAIFLSLIYRVFPNWHMIVFLGALCTNISAILAGLSVCNVTNSKKIALLMGGGAELLLALTWRSFLVYSDCWGMLFVALVAFIYTSKLKYRYKIPMLFFAGAVGAFIKITVLIVILAIALYSIFNWLLNNNRISWKKLLYIIACAALFFGGMLFVQYSTRRYYNLKTGNSTRGWQYWLMLGQNSDYYGVYNGDDPKLWNTWAGSFGANDANQLAQSEALHRIKSRGILGNLSFYLRKITVAYNDAYFHNVLASGENASGWGSLYYTNGAHYAVLANLFQFIWDGVLLLLFLSAVLRRRFDVFDFFKIAVFGVTLYLMIFENRSKYLYMFLPVYMAAAGTALYHLSEIYNKASMTLVHANTHDQC